MIIQILMVVLVLFLIYKGIFMICYKYHREHTVYNKIFQKEWKKNSENEYVVESEGYRLETVKSALKDGSVTNYKLYINDILKYESTDMGFVSFLDRHDDFNALRRLSKKIEKSLEFKHIENLDFLK